MQTYTYPDGSAIELGSGDTYPPGHVGQHTNCSRPWFRKAGGEWREAPDGARSSHDAWVLVRAAESADDAWAALYPEP